MSSPKRDKARQNFVVFQASAAFTGRRVDEDQDRGRPGEAERFAKDGGPKLKVGAKSRPNRGPFLQAWAFSGAVLHGLGLEPCLLSQT